MIRKVIAYFNKELKFYESIKIIENQANDNIIGSCKRYVGMCAIKEAPNLVGRSIHIIGEFDDENIDCPLTSYEAPVLVVDCDEILKSRFPSIYEQGIERIETGN